MKIKNFIAVIMFTISSYGCANSTTNNSGESNNIEYLDVFFTYYKQGEDPSKALDLKIPKDTGLININTPILINFKNQDYDEKYKVVVFNKGRSSDAKFPNFLISGEENNIIEVIDKKDLGLAVQYFIINYEK